MIDEQTRSLARGANFAALATLGADGRPQVTVVWVDADDEHLLVNTEIHRAKYKNMIRDPRVAVAVISSENPYEYVQVRGNVVGEVRGEKARSHIDELSERYTGHAYTNPITTERVIVEIAPAS